MISVIISAEHIIQTRAGLMFVAILKILVFNIQSNSFSFHRITDCIDGIQCGNKITVSNCEKIGMNAGFFT